MTQQQFDFIVLGQGLAGTLVSHELISRGKTVMVIDNGHPHSASRVAAGLYNPLTFKRLNFAWNAVEALPLMEPAYGKIEESLGEAFNFRIPIRRYFPDDQSHEQFMLKQDLPLYEPVLGKTDDFGEHGSGLVHGGGYVNLRKLLPAFRAWLESRGCFSEDEIGDEQIQVEDGCVRVGRFMAEKLIFCRGVKDVESMWWNHLPLKQTKGEVLTVTAPELSQDSIHNNGKFVLPLGDASFRTGSTYEWDEINEEPTEKGRDQILDKLKELHQGPVDVTEHQAGIRPTVKDRRPLVGSHPEQHNFFILNGLGTRGVMIGPWCAVQLADYILKNSELNKEIDVDRFK